MTRKAILCPSLVLLALFGGDAALACSCAPPPPPQEAMQQSEAVFTGTVLDVSTSGSNRRVRFRVERVWKGARCGEVTLSTGLGDADCGYDFQAGQSYLVYAHRTRGKLGTNICTRTRPVAEASEDLTALGAPSKDCTAG